MQNGQHMHMQQQTEAAPCNPDSTHTTAHPVCPCAAARYEPASPARARVARRSARRPARNPGMAIPHAFCSGSAARKHRVGTALLQDEVRRLFACLGHVNFDGGAVLHTKHHSVAWPARKTAAAVRTHDARGHARKRSLLILAATHCVKMQRATLSGSAQALQCRDTQRCCAPSGRAGQYRAAQRRRRANRASGPRSAAVLRRHCRSRVSH